jgi:hypothetical protein
LGRGGFVGSVISQVLIGLRNGIPSYIVILDSGVAISKADSLFPLIVFAHFHPSSHFN